MSNEQAEFGEIRTLMINEDPYLVGKDVATALGYSNPRDALVKHCKGVVKCDALTNGGKQELSFIPESDIYRLAFGSKLPTAERFTDWVTEEVLPTIHKHGAYMTPDVLEQTIQNPDFMIQLCTELKAEQERRRHLETTVAVQEQQIQELKPKASYYDLVLNCPDLLSTSVIAKDYGKSAKWLNAYLHEHGIQFKQGKIWLLYQKYAEQGYTSTKTHNVNGADGQQHLRPHTYWTQKGRLFIYDLLKSDGIYPIVEQNAA